MDKTLLLQALLHFSCVACPRHSAQPRCWDVFAGFLTDAVRTIKNPADGGIDLDKSLLLLREKTERHVMIELVRRTVGHIHAVRFQRLRHFSDLHSATVQQTIPQGLKPSVVPGPLRWNVYGGWIWVMIFHDGLLFHSWFERRGMQFLRLRQFGHGGLRQQQHAGD